MSCRQHISGSHTLAGVKVQSMYPVPNLQTLGYCLYIGSLDKLLCLDYLRTVVGMIIKPVQLVPLYNYVVPKNTHRRTASKAVGAM